MRANAPALSRARAAAAAAHQVTYADVTAEARLQFKNDPRSRLPLTIVETTGGGAGFLDFDNDGWLDIYLVSAGGENRLFRNNHDGTFTDVTGRARAGDPGHYHMGACAADFDNDGWVDLYLTNYDRNTLLRNAGDGTFSDVTAEAGVGDARWSVGCAFLDYDRDGFVDLYVTDYVRFTGGPRLCTLQGIESNCLPHLYPPESHVLYHNNGDGTFSDVSQAAGIAAQKARGMGVVAFDYNNDGWPDIAVANDGDGNFLFRNRGDGTFAEVALLAGTAYNRDGHAGSSMGIDFADYDQDGNFDLVVTNFQNEPCTLFRNLGKGLFIEEGGQRGIAEPTLPFVGWGAGFIDFDNDGDKDIFFANGHVHHNASSIDRSTSFALRPQLFENRGSTFVEVSKEAGTPFSGAIVGRGAAFGDYDNDGDVDILVNVLAGPAKLLRNETGNTRHWITIRAIGSKTAERASTGTNRSAVGTRIVVTADGSRQMDEVRGGGSYASFNDSRLHFGLGEATEADVEIRWLGGPSEILRGVAADQFVVVTQGQGAEYHRLPAGPRPN